MVAKKLIAELNFLLNTGNNFIFLYKYLFFIFSERVKKFLAKLSRNKEEFNKLDSEYLYVEKINNGLYTLERVALILAEVCANGPIECRERAVKMFRMKLKNPSIGYHIEGVC